jgi:RNA polymerase sigma-70 factor (ECF subfamily)
MARVNSESHEDSESPTGKSSKVTSPEQWVDASVAGDRGAMQRLYEHCSGRVYALMVRMVGRQDADDLTQQVFLQMFRKLAQFKGQSKLETWLYRIATNEALQYLRRKQRHAMAPLVVEPVAEATDRIATTEESQLLETAMSRIEPELRAILLLKEQQLLSYREIAESIGIPEGTVGSRLNRARRELREQLTKLGWD